MKTVLANLWCWCDACLKHLFERSHTSIKCINRSLHFVNFDLKTPNSYCKVNLLNYTYTSYYTIVKVKYILQQSIPSQCTTTQVVWLRKCKYKLEQLPTSTTKKTRFIFKNGAFAVKPGPLKYLRFVYFSLIRFKLPILVLIVFPDLNENMKTTSRITIVFWNDVCCAMYGKNDDRELLKKLISSLFLKNNLITSKNIFKGQGCSHACREGGSSFSGKSFLIEYCLIPWKFWNGFKWFIL